MAVVESDIFRHLTVEVWPRRVCMLDLVMFVLVNASERDACRVPTHPVAMFHTLTSLSQPPLTNTSSQGTMAHTPMT
jgi:hypothetical protein